jgi:creatinine amidohydrolase/Fe(II)-dependent formamide hydrolase-like protein
MSEGKPSRLLGELTFKEIASAFSAKSILCLPVGSMEQHGPHLPLNTDTVLAEAFTCRIIERWGKSYELWQLPSLAVGLSGEHAWATGTLSLSVMGMTALLRDLGSAIALALPTKNLLIVNGHGGNRGILEAVTRELRGDFGINACTLHLGAVMRPIADAAVPEIHAGKDETSAMLALAPELVRRERITDAGGPPDGDMIRRLILDPGASFPWTSEDSRLARAGVIGDARDASAEHGNAIIAHVLEAAGAALALLLENRTACDRLGIKRMAD